LQFGVRGRRRRNRGGEGQQRDNILTFINEITDGNIALVIPSVILMVKGSRHCKKIPV
jgi:hypothetical protein